MDAIAEGSGECIDKIVNDSQKADLVSPASEVLVRLGNAEGRASDWPNQEPGALTGGDRDLGTDGNSVGLAGQTDRLV